MTYAVFWIKSIVSYVTASHLAPDSQLFNNAELVPTFQSRTINISLDTAREVEKLRSAHSQSDYQVWVDIYSIIQGKVMLNIIQYSRQVTISVKTMVIMM